jgi:Rrf2 family protein
MQLSAQEEYGLRCLLQVARREDRDEPLCIPDIAEAEGLSPEYTAKLMRALRQAGFVTSTRGATGGYRLARPAALVTVWEVLDMLGGPIFSEAFCESHPGNQRDCVHTSNCSLRALWRFIGAALKEALTAVSLADLVRNEQPMLAWLEGEPLVRLGKAGARPGGMP